MIWKEYRTWVPSVSTNRFIRLSTVCSVPCSSFWVESWYVCSDPNHLRVSGLRWSWEDCWSVSTSLWVEYHGIQSAFLCLRWWKWLLRILLPSPSMRWISWWMWSHNEISCEITLAICSSPCWMRVTDCTSCNRRKCIVHPRNASPQHHSNTRQPHVHNNLSRHSPFHVTEWTHRCRPIIFLDFDVLSNDSSLIRCLFTLSCI